MRIIVGNPWKQTAVGFSIDPFIGIGVSDPDVALEILAVGGQLKLSHNANISISQTVDASSVFTIRSPVAGQIKFRPVGTEQIDFFQVVNGSGGSIFSVDALNDMVGIGLGSDPPGTILDINSNSDVQQLRIDRAGTTVTDIIIEVVSNVGGANTTVGKWLVDGDLENVNNSYTGISSRQLKDNILPVKPQLNKFMKLKFKNFNFKNNPTLKQFGLIADEVEKIYPGLLKTNPETGIQAIKYSILNLIGNAAFQEHMEKFHNFKEPEKEKPHNFREIEKKSSIVSILILIFLLIILFILYVFDRNIILNIILNMIT